MPRREQPTPTLGQRVWVGDYRVRWTCFGPGTPAPDGMFVSEHVWPWVGGPADGDVNGWPGHWGFSKSDFEGVRQQPGPLAAWVEVDPGVSPRCPWAFR